MAEAKIKQKHIPERMCSICRKRFPKKELLRFVQDSEGLARLDIQGKSAGRGLYVCYDYTCWERVLNPDYKRNSFKIHKESLAILEGLHARRKQDESKHERREQDLLNTLGMARRAGRVSLGGEATCLSIESGEAELVLLATDISENSLNKMRRTLEANPITTFSLLDKAKLSRAVGKSPLAVCSVNDVGFAQTIKELILGVNNNYDKDNNTEVER